MSEENHNLARDLEAAYLKSYWSYDDVLLARRVVTFLRDQSWKSIETAPRHGKILLWWKHAGVGVGSWDDAGNGWRCRDDDCVPKNQSDCTHWKPEPEGPAITS